VQGGGRSDYADGVTPQPSSVLSPIHTPRLDEIAPQKDRELNALGVRAGDYARVEHVDARENRLTVRTDEGNSVICSPQRLQGVTLYHESECHFSVGDRRR
jgi:hypothetical protein